MNKHERIIEAEKDAIMEVQKEINKGLPFEFTIKDMREFGHYYLEQCIKKRKLGDEWIVRTSLVDFIKRKYPERNISIVQEYFGI